MRLLVRGNGRSQQQSTILLGSVHKLRNWVLTLRMHVSKEYTRRVALCPVSYLCDRKGWLASGIRFAAPGNRYSRD